ncbi:Trp biosynthesis-associated membrane protein (plasmid) [Microbacterium sp. NIBRBAC000506063]|nr:Trp biosynthesis-associated membrane protein [Microbacterium sp. NIBRBAC000506063]
MTRGRSLSVLLLVLVGGLGILSSTQTWLFVSVSTAAETVEVSGADALPILAPLSLTILALAGVLAIVGRMLRYVFAAIAVAIGVWLLIATLPLVTSPPLSAAAGTVTELTGLAGHDAVATLVEAVVPTSWPLVTLVLWVLLLAAAAFIAASAHRWRTAGKRFRTDGQTHTGPIDAIDSWDDLSRGSDPTR